jgi:hypothetical protein
VADRVKLLFPIKVAGLVVGVACVIPIRKNTTTKHKMVVAEGFIS